MFGMELQDYQMWRADNEIARLPANCGWKCTFIRRVNWKGNYMFTMCILLGMKSDVYKT